LAQFGGHHWPAIARAHENAFLAPADDPTNWRAVASRIVLERLPKLE
jgi:hypothetical protein